MSKEKTSPSKLTQGEGGLTSHQLRPITSAKTQILKPKKPAIRGTRGPSTPLKTVYKPLGSED